MLKRLSTCRPSHALGRDKGDKAEHSRRDQPLHVDLRERLGDIARSRREKDGSRDNHDTRESGQDRGLREFQRNNGIKQSARLDFLENSGFQTNFRIPKKQEADESSITEEITSEFGKILLERSNEKPKSKAAKQRQRKKTRKAAEKHESESNNEVCIKNKKEQQEDCTCKKCLNETCKGAIQKFRELEKNYSKTMPNVEIKTNVDNNKANLSYKTNSNFTAAEVTAAKL